MGRDNKTTVNFGYEFIEETEQPMVGDVRVKSFLIVAVFFSDRY